jgi:hypothetical protein
MNQLPFAYRSAPWVLGSLLAIVGALTGSILGQGSLGGEIAGGAVLGLVGFGWGWVRGVQAGEHYRDSMRKLEDDKDHRRLTKKYGRPF